MTLQIGTKVRCHIPGHGTPPNEAWVIGRMHYDASVVCIATEEAHGMPVHEAHCTPIKGDDPSLAAKWRKRYLRMYGDHWFTTESNMAKQVDLQKARNVIACWNAERNLIHATCSRYPERVQRFRVPKPLEPFVNDASAVNEITEDYCFFRMQIGNDGVEIVETETTLVVWNEELRA